MKFPESFLEKVIDAIPIATTLIDHDGKVVMEQYCGVYNTPTSKQVFGKLP